MTEGANMEIGVEISLYPLHQQYIPPIQDFIDRLNADGRLRVVTNTMSTQVFGQYDDVMQRLVQELRGTFAANDKAVFVMKVLGPLAAAAS
jgi:uncharacterized protein YqgV (UPF0045/DUF77 family)